MTRNAIKTFYGSVQWQKCRESYKKSVGGLCERCLTKGLIVPAVHVHHIVPLTNSTVNNPKIATCFENLMALCEDCHNEIHHRVKQRYRINEDGTVVMLE